MSQAVQFRAGYESMLASLIDGLDLWAHLYTNDPPLSIDTVVDDFVEVIYDGYVAQIISRWTPPALRSGRAFTVADPLFFVFSGGVEPLPVRGYYATYGPTGPAVFGWRRPGDAYQLALPTPLLTILVTLHWPPAS